MGYLEEIDAKRQQKTDTSRQDDFLSSLSAVSSDIRELLASLEVSGAKKLERQVVESIASLQSIVKELKSVRVQGDSETMDILRSVVSSIERLNVRPIVNVPKTQVTVKEPDFAPIIKAIQPVKQEGNPLAGYVAQDINDDDPHTQYIGFVKADGGWYIIENNDTTNTLRYKFGTKGYAQSFKNAKKLNYMLYSEAINEVSS
jgi:hypothetical protein